MQAPASSPEERSHRPTPQFAEDLQFWIDTEPKVASRLVRIMRETLRDPFRGIGKPEPLQGELGGCWSRRLTDEDRVVYQVTNEAITFLLGRYHY